LRNRQQRDETACAAYGTPLEPDQVACLECGHITRRRRSLIPSGWPLRAGLASTTALLVSACAGLGVSAAFQGGGKVPKTAAAPTTPSNPTIPPAPAPPSPSAPATPSPGAQAPAPAKPATPAKPAVTTPAPSHSGSVTGPSGGGGGSGGGQTTAPAQPGGGQAAPFPDGVTPDSANLLDAGDTADHPNKVQNVNDGDPRTTWSTASSGFSHSVGIWLDAGSYIAYRKLGILAKGPSYSVQIYGSNANSAPSAPPTQAGSGWTRLDAGSPSTPVSSGKNRIPLSEASGYQPRYYLIWITAVSGTNATIAETALIG